jgi:hypothetical protein
MKRSLVRLAFASGVWTRASDLRRLFRCLTLGAAVLARRRQARTERVGTLLGFRRVHFLVLPTSDQVRMIQVQMLVPRKKCFCAETNTLRYWSLWSHRRWQSVGFRDKSCPSLQTAGAKSCGFPARESSVVSQAPRVRPNSSWPGERIFIKGGIHLRRLVFSSLSFPLQSCGGPYIHVTYLDCDLEVLGLPPFGLCDLTPAFDESRTVCFRVSPRCCHLCFANLTPEARNLNAF